MFQKSKSRPAKSRHSSKTENRDSHKAHRRKSEPGLLKRKILFSVVVLAVAIAVPYIFATAADNNQVADSTVLNPAQSSLTTPVPTPTLPAVTNEQLTSDLTETAVQADPAPTPASAASPMPSAASTPVPSAEPAYTVIKSGTDDPFVAIIQQRLMDLDYMEQDDPTTLFGPVTSQAVQYFQRKNGLPVDGVAGVETQKLLFSANAKLYTVSEGASGPDVESIQDRLHDLGYQVDTTGYFGSDTTKAVSYFQRMNGLTDDGNVGSDTREKLYSDTAEPSLEYSKKNSSSGSGSSSSGSSSGKSGGTGASASGGSGTSTKPAQPANPGNVEAFVAAAKAQLGKPYVWGGKGPNSFDCSGFVYYALKISGNGIGYMTSAGWHNSGYTKISKMSDLQRGDIIDFKGHVGIYLGNGQMLDASSSEGKIRITGALFTGSYWLSHFLEGRRIF